MSANLPLVGFYDYRLVSLSVFIAILAAYAALDLAERVTTARGGARLMWLYGGAIAMGSGIWAMHYVGMEAFRLPVPVTYDWPTVLLSLVAAILASGVALYTVSRPTVNLGRRIAGGIFMGSGIAAMHYIGMYAMRLPAMCVYSPGLVLLSIILAIGISMIALQQACLFREAHSSHGWRKCSSALLLGLAIPVMHYVGMAAARFVPTSFVPDHDAVSVSNLGLACIVAVTLQILGFVFLSSMVNRRFSLQEHRLAENLVQLQAVFDNMTEAIVVVDAGRSIVQHNQAASKLLGIEGSMLSMQELDDTFEAFSSTGELLGLEERPIVQAIRGIYCKNTEVTIRRRDTGATITTEISTAPLAVSPDSTPRVILTFRDVTERKLMDETRTRLASIIESSTDAIIGKDDKGIVISWNTGAEKIFGYTADEMIGQPILRLLPDDRQREESDILARIKQGETVDHIETVRKMKNGQFIQVSLTISPIRDSRGRVIGASKVARNITERKQLERQLQQSQKMEAIGQLTGGVAHDFNNLLSVIVGNLGLIGRLASEDEAIVKRVKTAQKAAARGADLTHRLLAFSRNVELKAEPTRLHHSVRNMIELARTVGPEIKITTHFDDSIPLVLVDPSGLENALLNLVVNARDAMPKGGTLTVSTRLNHLEENYPPVQAGELKAGRYACISVSDTGHGMSKEILERVFEPFFTTKPRGKGTGLGLAMVYGFAKQSGGIVRIYSELGYGTTVSIYLPIAECGAQPLPAPIQDLPSAKMSGNVLVVDDELDVLEIAAVYLQEMGYTVFQASDGDGALEVLERQRNIDLMVTDIIMPGGMNGAELAQKARELLPHIRVIYSSGFAADVLEERSMTLVHGPLLNKPYQQEEFEAIVRSTMVGAERVIETA
jgi:PAS domain S-box-containing protein